MHTAQPTMLCVSMRPFLCIMFTMSLIDMPTRSLFADDDWHWLKSAVQANKLDVTSAGLWQDPEESSVQIALAPQGNVRLSRVSEVPPQNEVLFNLTCFREHLNVD